MIHTSNPNFDTKENLRQLLRKVMLATGILAIVYYLVLLAEGKLKNRR